MKKFFTRSLELRGDDGGIVGERVGRVALLPAAQGLQLLRQVPVIKRGPGLDAFGQQLVDQPVVEVEALRIERAAAVGKDARPGDREAIGAGAHRLHQGDVFLVAMEMVDRDVAGAAVGRLAALAREHVPDRDTAAVLERRALDLIGRRGGAPKKPLREPGRRSSGGRGNSIGRRNAEVLARRAVKRCRYQREPRPGLRPLNCNRKHRFTAS